MSPRTRRILKWTAIVAAVALAIVVTAFVWWGTHPLQATESALDALESDSAVTVTEADAGWEFAPASAEPTSGYIFYPGGHVDARAYAPYARDVAAMGYLVVVPKMPLSLAVLAPNSATKVVESHAEIDRWVIGGHSLGGAMAATYAGKNPDTVDGLVLLAAYASGVDLSDNDLTALTQVGTLDTVIDRTNLDAGRKLLPADATYEELEGGNHAQFGDYGPQPGDNPNPTMLAPEQHRRAVDSTVRILRAD